VLKIEQACTLEYGLGLRGVVLGNELVGVADMLMRLSIIQMERCDWTEAGYSPSNTTAIKQYISR